MPDALPQVQYGLDTVIMSDNTDGSGFLADDMGEYLQTFLDETDEQLDDLVETLLALEDDPTNGEDLNEAFRLIHSIKGSAGMMGLDTITVLTHQLENRFERFRSGLAQIDKTTMNLVLRCIDFLRTCAARLRAGENLGSAAELLDELKRLEDSDQNESEEAPAESPPAESPTIQSTPADSPTSTPDSALLHMVVQFRQGLQLADLKAQLILARLAKIVEIHSTIPDIDNLNEEVDLEKFEILLDTDEDPERFRSAANVEGVDSIEFVGETVILTERAETVAEDESNDAASTTVDGPAPDRESDTEQDDETHVAEASETEASDTETHDDDASSDQTGDGPVGTESSPHEATVTDLAGIATEADAATDSDDEDVSVELDAAAEASIVTEPLAVEATPRQEPEHASSSVLPAEDVSSAVPPVGQVMDGVGASHPPARQTPATQAAAASSAPKGGETMRVDIERLDGLMNLVGELVVNRARLEQISDHVDPAFRKTTMVNRFKEFSESLLRTIKTLEVAESTGDDWSAQIQQLRAGLTLLDEQSEIWDNGRQCFSEMSDAVDHLSRVSHGLQTGVLDTRMVPVGPLFNRFKRVVRDLSQERGKKVRLSILGEKTELDKRMIDELGDPLVHLVRNSIDHGLESPEVRRQLGKPEEGSISLEASHSGNNVYIHVRDDGGGINVEKIKAKLLDRKLMSPAQVSELTDEEVLDQIWNPGFSTAEALTDVSGRGVGMDVVKTRVQQLKGTINVDSTLNEGTTFTIRLPLTMAIINSLLVRLEDATFSMPIDDVREIVSVEEPAVVTIQNKQTFEVRGEYIPLVKIDDVFRWHDLDYGHKKSIASGSGHTRAGMLDIVILQSRGKALGLQVDELLGGQDIVIKSLSDNFVDIQGLSGASILGDGSVCLMLDVTTLFEMAINTTRVMGEKESAL